MGALDEFVSEQFSVFRRPKGLAGRNNVYPRFGWPVEPWNCSEREGGRQGGYERAGTRWKESVTTSGRGKKREEIGVGEARGRGGG